MDHSKDRIVRWLYAKFDLLSILAAWLLAYYLRFYGPFPVFKGIPQWPVYLKLIPFLVIIWFVVFGSAGFYSKTKNYRSSLFESLAIVRYSLISIILFAAVTYFYEEYHYSRLTLGLFAVLQPVSIIFARSILRKFLRAYQRYYPARKILLIGSGPILVKAFEVASSFDLARFQLVGFIGIASVEEQITHIQNLAKEQKWSLFAVPENWANFFKKNPCETVIIALPNDCQDFLNLHLEAIAAQVPDIKLMPDLSYLDRFNTGIELIQGNPVINIHDSPLKGIASIQKRIFDFFGGIACILVFSPLLILTALLVKLSSRGSIFYQQERMGLDGRTFNILKFRTMAKNAEQASGAVWATKGDSRVTAVGKFLRKSSLDELPQLFNVVMGDMSLVGPRPERPIFVDQFRQSVPGYMLRHKVKAGMTGWAQVNGWRGNTSIEKRIESDLYYIQNWSLWLDIKILCLTLIKGFVNPNAY